MRTRHRTCFAMAVAVMLIMMSAATPPSAYAQNRMHKLGRGTVNLFTGWLELFPAVRDGSQEENPLLGTFLGLFKGVGRAAVRTAIGAYEIVTFPVPMPAGYAPISEPEFVFGE